MGLASRAVAGRRAAGDFRRKEVKAHGADRAAGSLGAVGGAERAERPHRGLDRVRADAKRAAGCLAGWPGGHEAVLAGEAGRGRRNRAGRWGIIGARARRRQRTGTPITQQGSASRLSSTAQKPGPCPRASSSSATARRPTPPFFPPAERVARSRPQAGRDGLTGRRGDGVKLSHPVAPSAWDPLTPSSSLPPAARPRSRDSSP